ncbi:hypothetical protein chiPu_0018423, partial [Chiloscyllium punctatum]|nr:hypothetical protein [Chiloscyllium punctatum]
SCSCSVEALKLLTVRGKGEELLRMMEEEKSWDLMRSPESHHQGVAVLARAMAQHGVTHLSSIVEQLAPMLSSPYEGQRVTTVAFFGEDKDAVRAAAFTVFGKLSRFGDGQSKADFVEQIHSSLVSLLLHLNDSSEEVVKACKFTLRLVGPLLGSESVSVMLQKHLLEEANLHYGEFINDLVKHIISDFPEKVNFYIMGNVSFFKSVWPEIRGNAVMFTGFLLGNLSQDELRSISLEHVCTAIILLLRDGVPSVRIKAAEALSLLHEL